MALVNAVDVATAAFEVAVSEACAGSSASQVELITWPTRIKMNTAAMANTVTFRGLTIGLTTYFMNGFTRIF